MIYSEEKIPVISQSNQCILHMKKISRAIEKDLEKYICVEKKIYGNDKGVCKRQQQVVNVGGAYIQRIKNRWYVQGLASWENSLCNSTLTFSYSTHTILTKVSQFEKWIGHNMDLQQNILN